MSMIQETMEVMDILDIKLETRIDDSGTESYTDSPNPEEDSEQSEDSTICDTDIKTNGCDNKLLKHILDQSLSVDEECLDAPLKPIRYSSSTDLDNNESGVEFLTPPGSSDRNLCSILRRGSCCENKSSTSLDSYQSSLGLRRVSFPNSASKLASFMYTDTYQPWEIEFQSTEEILQAYQSSCKVHQTIELDSIKDQINKIQNNMNHSATLNLAALNITRDVNETLEDLLKVSNFKKIVLSDSKFTADTITEFLNMLEYYESVREIEVCMDFYNKETWKAFCSTCSNIVILESLSFKGIHFNGDIMQNLVFSVKNNHAITTLRFDGCPSLPFPYLLDSLMTNTTIQELYLPSTGIYTKEADTLGRFLQKNHHLKVLDISNNFIGDRGLEVLSKGLIKQNDAERYFKQTLPETGLSVLIIFNNQITEKSGPVLNNIISKCKHLHSLNVGYNNLTDQVLFDIKEGLIETKSLEGLGLQCTLLTCKGIDALAEAIECNTSLEKINLKGNKAIQVPGLEKLCQALTNSTITRIEIDETNRSCNDPDAYLQIVKKITGICTVNKSYADSREDSDEEIINISRIISRKMSLSCEPRFHVPEVTHKPVSPPTKSRFSITPVTDGSVVRSRFSVTRVMPSPDEEEESGRFANVRSSVSSNDSVDSLMTSE